MASTLDREHSKTYPARYQNLTGRRWTGVAAMGVIAAVIVLVTGPWWIPGDASTVMRVVHSSTFWGAVLVALVVGSVLYGWRTPACTCRRVHWWRYPSLWWAAALGWILVCAAVILRPEYLHELGYNSYDADALGTAASFRELSFLSLPLGTPCIVRIGRMVRLVPRWLACVRRRTQRCCARLSTQPPAPVSGSTAHAAEMPRLGETFEGLLEWLANDREIEDEREDLFDFHTIAQRMAERLIDSPNRSRGARPTMALVGDVGSGKSSVIRLMHQHLFVLSAADRGDGGTSGQLEVVTVSLWPYATAEVAVEGILRAVVSALGSHVTVVDLVGLPEAYVSAVASIEGILARVAQRLSGLLSTTLSPEDLLARIDERLAAIGLHLVLAIEDLERFASGHDRIAPTGATGRSAHAEVAPIQALLHLLDRCNGISVVLAAASLDLWHDDVAKVARYVERVPAIRQDHGLEILRTFRNGCLGRLERENLNDPGAKYRGSLGHELAQDPGSAAAIRETVHPDMTTEEALASWVSNPRCTKMALRTCLEVWSHLAGDLDLDDLLAISLLREAEPQLFAWVEDNIGHLRGDFARAKSSSGGNRDSNQTEQQDPLQAELQRFEGQHGPRRRHAAESVLTFIFREDSELGRKPQGLAARQNVNAGQHGDYWQRYLSVVPIPPSISDQTVLRAIHAWRHDQQADCLVDLLMNPERGWAVRHFAQQLADEGLLDLLGMVTDACVSRATDGPRTAGDTRTSEALYRMREIIGIWRELARQIDLSRDNRTHLTAGREEKIRTCVRELIRATVPLNLEVTHTLALLPWTNGLDHDVDRMCLLHEHLASSFSPEQPHELVHALAGAPWLLVYWLWMDPALDNRVAALIEQNPHAWPAFAETLVNAADALPLGPVRVLPQLLAFITRQEGPEGECVIDSNAVEQRFQDLQDRIWQLFRDHPLAVEREQAEWRPLYDVVIRHVTSR